MSEEVTLLPATGDLVLRALTDGGRAAITVRSKESGQHVSIVLSVRKRNGDKGWVSRATKAGRVGILEGDVVEARDPSVEYPDNYVGRFYLDKRAWRAGREADPIRVWTAEKILQFALAGNPVLGEKADVLLATTCCQCGKPLRDPESIERLTGPECFGKATKSKRAKEQLPLDGPGSAAKAIAAALTSSPGAVVAVGSRYETDYAPAVIEASEAAALTDPRLGDYPPCMACGGPDDHEGRCAI